MARKLKKVQVIHHPSGVSVDVLINQGSLEFLATPIDGVSMVEKSFEALKQRVWKYLDENLKIEWVPVISVNEQKPFCASDYAFIGLEIERFYVGKSPTEGLRESQWNEVDETELNRVRLSRSFHGFKEIKFPQRCDSRGDSMTHYLAYSEGVWLALNQIREAIARIKEQLRETLETDAGIQRLESFGSRMQKLIA